MLKAAEKRLDEAKESARAVAEEAWKKAKAEMKKAKAESRAEALENVNPWLEKLVMREKASQAE